jgi:hypothetical protein
MKCCSADLHGRVAAGSSGAADDGSGFGMEESDEAVENDQDELEQMEVP